MRPIIVYIAIFTVASLLSWLLWSLIFTNLGSKIRVLFGGCDHRWLDDTVPFSDLYGGQFTCTKCGKKRYIHWGFEYRQEKELGHIVEDGAQEDKLMAQYAPELYRTQLGHGPAYDGRQTEVPPINPQHVYPIQSDDAPTPPSPKCGESF